MPRSEAAAGPAEKNL